MSSIYAEDFRTARICELVFSARRAALPETCYITVLRTTHLRYLPCGTPCLAIGNKLETSKKRNKAFSCSVRMPNR